MREEKWSRAVKCRSKMGRKKMEEEKENRERVTGRTQGKNKKKMRNRISRETREGRPLLTVETKVNGESKSTNERVPSSVGSLCLACRYKILFSFILPWLLW